jgi:hypothetical protein
MALPSLGTTARSWVLLEFKLIPKQAVKSVVGGVGAMAVVQMKTTPRVEAEQRIPPSLWPTKHFTKLNNQCEVFGRQVPCRTGHAFTEESRRQFLPGEDTSAENHPKPASKPLGLHSICETLQEDDRRIVSCYSQSCAIRIR